ncbi:MAG TPA: hypothetical protein VII02_09650 [Gemmatimonadaceae bacterium]
MRHVLAYRVYPPVTRLHVIASSAAAKVAGANDLLARMFMESDAPLANGWPTDGLAGQWTERSEGLQ